MIQKTVEVTLTTLGKPIALGRTAEIYPWREGQVLKLFREWMSAEAVDYEARIARAVVQNGVRAPAVGEIIEVGGRLGLVYERIDGEMLVSSVRKRPWTLKQVARLLAKLHAEMHILPACGLPPQRERLRAKIHSAEPLPEDLKEAALGALEKLPDGDRLCHGDFHPENVLIAQGGPVIIDWVDATCGHPLADVARSYLLVTGGSLPSGKLAERIEGRFRKQIGDTYLKEYFAIHSEGQDLLSRWIPVVAAARLSENIAEEEAGLLVIAGQAR